MSDAMNGAIDHLLEAAAAQKLDVEVLATEKQSTKISFQARKLNQFSVSEAHQIGVRVIDGGHEGVAYSESLERGSLDEMLALARENARMIEKEIVAELRGAQKLPAMDFLYDHKLAQVAVEDKIKAATELEGVALDFDPDIQAVAYSAYSDGCATTWVANSKGLRGSYKQNYCLGYTHCLAKDAEGAVMDGEIEVRRSFDSLNPREIAKQGAEAALARRGAVRPRTGTYTVVFENRAAESLLGFVANYFSAKAVDESRSPLKGKLGQRVFSPRLFLTDDPFFEKGIAGRPFDEEGFAAQKTPLVEEGTLRNFLTNSVLARKLKLPHTASAARAPSTDLDVSSTNILVKPGEHTLAQLLGSDAKVILVTSLNGSAGFRAASGDFSIPMEGFLYEQGKLASPLKDFLISGNILNLLGAVEGVGNDARSPVGGVVSPSLMVRGLNVAGRS